jgi:hypothetical protein
MDDESFKAIYGKPKDYMVKLAKSILPKSEQPKEGKLNEASPHFATMSREFVGALTPPFNHTKISNALKNANSLIGKLTDPNEKNQAGSMIGTLTNMADTTTGQSALTARPRVRVAGKGPFESKKIKEGQKDKEDETPKPDQKNKPKADPPKEAPEPKEPPKGLEEPPQEQEPKKDDQGSEQSIEQKTFTDSMTGQVIKSASIQPTPNGGSVNFELQGIEMPVKIEFGPGQKITFYYKNRPYYIRK